jgi:hypothetical protein
MHHLLLDAGFSPSQVALILGGLTAFLGMAAMAAIYAHVPQIVLVLVFLVLIGAHYAFTSDRERAVRGLDRLHVGMHNLAALGSSRRTEGVVGSGQFRARDESRAKL